MHFSATRKSIAHKRPAAKAAALLSASSAVALATIAFGASSAAYAQVSADASTEEVVVSSTRVQRAGFNAPTPTTVVNASDLEKQAPSNVFTAIQQLPSLLGSTGVQVANNTTSAGNTGLSAFGLHGLGPIRTLTLIDGQRVVPAFVQGTTDISQFPQLLIQRVDVVTGGASASYGSDAVGGVVNFVLDKNFNGFKGNLLGGVSTYGDDENMTLQLAAGMPFADGRGHFELSTEYSYEAGVGPGNFGVGCDAGKSGRCWYSAPTLLQRSIANTPAGLPEYSFATNVQDYQLARYGLITAGPLQGTAFGTGGAPFPFVYGSAGVPSRTAAGTVSNCVSPFCVGGDTTGNIGMGTSLASSLNRGNVYTRLSYDLTPSTNIWATFIGSQVHTSNFPSIGAFRPANLTIQCSNPFLPASIVTACGANAITNFQYGTDNAELTPLGSSTVINQRDLLRGVVGADGKFNLFDTDWSWNSYFEHGDNHVSLRVRNIFLVPYYNAAIDAAAGPNGTVVCRSAAAQTLGCVPLNVIGNVAANPSAVKFIDGNNTYSPGPSQITHERQDAFSFILNGEPFSDWAGPVSIATGVEYREEAYSVVGDPAGNGGTNDPLLSSAGNNWFAGNFHNGAGNYHVNEGFVETVVPLVHDDSWGHADLDLAGRATGYSTAGYVNTWKAGVTWDTPLDGVRVRALQSRDVRAPNLSELFSAPIVSNNTVINQFLTPPTQVSVQFAAVGNTALQPEKSTNTEVGLVLQPTWFPGFNLSVDYYRIAVKGQVGSLSAQNEVDLCQQGFTAQCAAIITTTGGPPQTTPFLRILTQSFNLATVVTDGFDIESSYQFPLSDLASDMGGDVTLRVLATHVSKFITNSGVPGTIPIETAGTNNGSIPHWKMLGVQTYQAENWSVTLTENWISNGVINRNYIECTAGCPLPTSVHPTIDSNHITGAFYLSVGGSYDWTDNISTYFKVDNITNLDPPPTPGTAPNQYGANPSLYDTIGRMFHVGVRFKSN